MQELTFEKWKEAVEEAMLRKYFVTTGCCPDVDFWGLYKTGDTPEEAADFVFENAQIS